MDTWPNVGLALALYLRCFTCPIANLASPKLKPYNPVQRGKKYHGVTSRDVTIHSTQDTMCPKIEGFWKRAIEITSRVIGIWIEQDPKLWILGDTSSVKVNNYKKDFILLASTVAKKCVLINWKSENSPTVRHWINELVSYCTPEKILYNVRGKHAAFGKIWGPFLDVLPSLNLVDCGDVNLPGPSWN